MQLEKDQKRLEVKQKEYERRIKDLSLKGEEREEERKSMEKILKSGRNGVLHDSDQRSGFGKEAG